jgi:exodeoxyribonuclease-5
LFDLKNISLTVEQQDLVNALMDWYNNKTNEKPYYSYSGKAGTGKTSVIKFFINELGFSSADYAAACYTGKGSLVLEKNGLNASTIHSLIYNTYLKTELLPSGETKSYLTSILKKSLYPASIKLIIIDEATMVNDRMKDEILSFGIPTVFLGDNNQLPPIFGISSVMLNPDFTLTKIMRQEENNPIIQFTEAILNDEPLYYGEYGKSKVVRSVNIDKNILKDYEIIICAKNSTRDALNEEIRHHVLGIPKDVDLPCKGEKVICRQNNWGHMVSGISLTNGLIGFVKDIDYKTEKPNKYIMDFQPDFMHGKDLFKNLKCDKHYTATSITDHRDYGFVDPRLNKFEYAYAVSCHIMQGSQYDRVLFLDELFHDEETTKKLRYTAISRAAESITIVSTTGLARRRIW